ncbi:MAG: hypothetical protein F6K32_22215 [Desertifilum sp. SIO1I2]|nr:hypothetical protein [Desertifilum sp. SIO1I2]
MNKQQRELQEAIALVERREIDLNEALKRVEVMVAECQQAFKEALSAKHE